MSQVHKGPTQMWKRTECSGLVFVYSLIPSPERRQIETEIYYMKFLMGE